MTPPSRLNGAARRGPATQKLLTCSCGANFYVPTLLTGKVRCPGCASVRRVSALQEK